MTTQVNATESSLKPAHARGLVVDFLKDKRKSMGIFKTLDIADLNALSERLDEVVTVKKEAAARKAEQERREREQIDSAISETMAHLKSQGFKFNRDEVAKLLAQKIKPVEIAAPVESLSKHDVSASHQNLDERVSHVSSNIQQR